MDTFKKALLNMSYKRAVDLDNWLLSNWVTKDSFYKYRIKVNVSSGKEIYQLYPSKWRNAKRLISSFELTF